MHWEIELEGECSLAKHVLCEMCGLRDEAEVMDSECISSGNALVQPVYPSPQPLLQVISICKLQVVYLTAEVTEASSLAVARPASTTPP